MGDASVMTSSGERPRSVTVPSIVYTDQESAPASIKRSPTIRPAENAALAAPAVMTTAAPTEASAKPAIFPDVSRSPANAAITAVATGVIVGTMSAPSEAGASVSPTKTSAL